VLKIAFRALAANSEYIENANATLTSQASQCVVGRSVADEATECRLQIKPLVLRYVSLLGIYVVGRL